MFMADVRVTVCVTVRERAVPVQVDILRTNFFWRYGAACFGPCLSKNRCYLEVGDGECKVRQCVLHSCQAEPSDHVPVITFELASLLDFAVRADIKRVACRHNPSVMVIADMPRILDDLVEANSSLELVRCSCATVFCNATPQ
jgi:hypothetical protein